MFRLPGKAALSTCFRCKKRQNTCQVSKLESVLIEDTKGFVSTDKFRDLRAPGVNMIPPLIIRLVQFIRFIIHLFIY